MNNKFAWEKYAYDYDNLNKLVAYQELIDQIGKNIAIYATGNPSVLELGIGTGNVMAKLLCNTEISRYVGIDNNSAMLSKAKGKTRGSLKIELVKKDGCDYVVENSLGFDVFIMNNFLYTIYDKETLLKSIHEKMSKSSILIISDPVIPSEYKYSIIVSKNLSKIQDIFTLVKCGLSFLRIYYYNRKIDKYFYRLSANNYLSMFKDLGFRLINAEKSYAGQANLFILAK